ncbi:hypothetical protein ABIE56_002338 [Luteibacter sp. 621]|jgi:hypothetical protein
MTAAETSLMAVAYGLVYYALARGSISRIMDTDPELRNRWQRPSFGGDAKNSLAILWIMFNMNLPKDSYPASLWWRIWSARVMLWLWPLVMFLALYFGRG